MTAKEAREYAKKQLSVVEGVNSHRYHEVIDIIKEAISNDPTKSYITLDTLPGQVIAWLNNAGYDTARYQAGPNETGIKISWSEDGIKQYENGDYKGEL